MHECPLDNAILNHPTQGNSHECKGHTYYFLTFYCIHQYEAKHASYESTYLQYPQWCERP